MWLLTWGWLTWGCCHEVINFRLVDFRLVDLRLLTWGGWFEVVDLRLSTWGCWLEVGAMRYQLKIINLRLSTLGWLTSAFGWLTWGWLTWGWLTWGCWLEVVDLKLSSWGCWLEVFWGCQLSRLINFQNLSIWDKQGKEPRKKPKMTYSQDGNGYEMV